MLWASAGILTISMTPGGAVSWHSFAFSQFTSGRARSVAICLDSSDDVYLVEVNEGGDGSLWSHTGQFQGVFAGTPSFSWIAGSDQHYDNGYSPRVACQPQPSSGPSYGMEVHAGAQGLGVPLWFHAFSVN